jgi:hypothetical protein
MKSRHLPRTIAYSVSVPRIDKNVVPFTIAILCRSKSSSNNADVPKEASVIDVVAGRRKIRRGEGLHLSMIIVTPAVRACSSVRLGG